MTVDRTHIGERLREQRLEQALAQADLARLARLDQATIVRIETGQVVPRPSTVRKLARALGVRPAVLTASNG